MNLVRISTLIMLTVVALVAGRKTASAQGFFGNFGGESDHHHHDAAGHRTDDAGHHIDNHGNHTGSWGVYDGDHSHEHYNSNSYNSYSVPRTTYYSPSQSTSLVPNSLPRPAEPIAVGGPIQITFPARQQGSVNYTLNKFNYKIQSGETQVIPSDRSWTIVFDRGGNTGTARYSLTPGTYEFSVEDKGWELRKKKLPEAELATDAPAPPAPAPPAAPAPTLAAGMPNAAPSEASTTTRIAPVAPTTVTLKPVTVDK